MTTLLPVAVAITTSGLPPPSRPVIFQRGERFLLVWTQLEHWPIIVAGALPKCAGQVLSQSSTLCMPGSGGAAGAGLGALLPLTATLVAATGCLCRLFRLRRLRFQRQDARDPVLVRINALLVPLDPEPNAHRLEQEDLGVVRPARRRRVATHRSFKVLRPIVCACSLECRYVIRCQTCRPSYSPSMIFHVRAR